MLTHRYLSLITVCALLALLAPPASCAAKDDPLDAVLADLHDAVYFTCHDVKAALPNGQITINDAVIGVFKGMDKRLAGMLLGDVDVELNDLPHGKGVLDLYREIDAARASTVLTDADREKHRNVSFHAQGGYLSASVSGGAQVLNGGRVSAVRHWSDLEKAEQAQFQSMYLQSCSDGWTAEPAPDAPPALKLRDPKDREVYIAMWLDNYTYHSGDDKAPVRLDYRVEADGKSVSLTDYGDNLAMFQSPWKIEDENHAALGLGEGDGNVQFKQIGYAYEFDPDAKPAHVKVRASASIALDKSTQVLTLISADWLGTPTGTIDNAEVKFARSPVDPWVLTATGNFAAGEHTLIIWFDANVPDVFSATGYGGVYRFDTTPLWPGEGQKVDISITASLPEGAWNFVNKVGSPYGGTKPANKLESEADSNWAASSRNCMLVATKFPLTTLDTAWGKLNVYAPPDEAASVPQMEHIQAVGEMLSYYESLWGPWDPKAATKEQNVFLIPDEEGVQAFEDAGMVFILGGQQSYGSGNVSLPLVAHEVAHLWWGQGVSGPRWFSEGMANYGAAKFMEQYYTEHPAPGSDPVSYRRYLINFALGHQLPLPLSRLDALADSAAVYHNSAAYLLTADNRLRTAGSATGLDGVLTELYTQHSFAAPLSESMLGDFFSASGGPMQHDLWRDYVEQGKIESSAAEDPTFREEVLTPSRKQYVELLRWLTPARRKQGLGDFAGALYCAQQAQKLRDEPKDRLLIAQLELSAGMLDEAQAGLNALIGDSGTDATTVLKARNSLAALLRKRGDSAGEKEQLTIVAKDGAAAGLMRESQAAEERLKELGGG